MQQNKSVVNTKFRKTIRALKGCARFPRHKKVYLNRVSSIRGRGGEGQGRRTWASPSPAQHGRDYESVETQDKGTMLADPS